MKTTHLPFAPDTDGQVIQLDFTSFEIQANTDILSIYNFDNADDPATLMR